MRKRDAAPSGAAASPAAGGAKAPWSSGRRRGRPESAPAIMERLLAAPAVVKIAGETRTVTAGEAIVRQLLHKAFASDARARAALLRYEEFARRGKTPSLEFIFKDSEYTAAFANSLGRRK